jgi:hypothetical protein
MLGLFMLKSFFPTVAFAIVDFPFVFRSANLVGNSFARLATRKILAYAPSYLAVCSASERALLR